MLRNLLRFQLLLLLVLMLVLLLLLLLVFLLLMQSGICDPLHICHPVALCNFLHSAAFAAAVRKLVNTRAYACRIATTTAATGLTAAATTTMWPTHTDTHTQLLYMETNGRAQSLDTARGTTRTAWAYSRLGLLYDSICALLMFLATRQTATGCG